MDNDHNTVTESEDVVESTPNDAEQMKPNSAEVTDKVTDEEDMI